MNVGKYVTEQLAHSTYSKCVRCYCYYFSFEELQILWSYNTEDKIMLANPTTFLYTV